MYDTARCGGPWRQRFWKKRPPVGACVLIAGLAGVLIAASGQAALGVTCKPNHFRPAFFVRTMGRCTFDPSSLNFLGAPAEQAKCLMRGMDASRNLVPMLSNLPPALEQRIGTDGGLPARETLSAFLSKQDLERNFAAYLWQPLSRANDNDPNAPMARYFVIHDTSGPNYGHRDFPPDLDSRAKVNNLSHFVCPDGWGKAHVVVNRGGEMLLNHDFALPWRETKFEQAANFAGALKGLFVHIELVQPRRSAAGHGSRNDAQSPNPPFTAAQYDRLALLYVITSVRADRWLIPAFHAAIDADIPNGHDDPLNFDIDSFANSLEALVAKLRAPPAETQSAAALPGPPRWQDATDAVAGPNASAMAATATAEGNPPPPGALVKSDADAQASPATAPQPVPEAEHKTARSPEAKALQEDESRRERKSTTRMAAAAEHCKTLVVKGHRRRVCRTAVAEPRGRRTRAHAVRTVDRRVSHQSDWTRHHGRDLRARHERGKARHHRD
jgi:hypothetical protein